MMESMPEKSRLVPFCKLADPAGYQPCDVDLTKDADSRRHWVPFFIRHLETILKLGVDSAVARGESKESAQNRASQCRVEFTAKFQAYAANPTSFGRVTILDLDAWRDALLRRHGFNDAFIDLKNRENENALPLVSAVCKQIDERSGREQLDAVILGVFAGNIFDMGAEATAKAFLEGSPDFFTTRKTISPRPWLIDDYDALAARFLDGAPYRKVVFFIDNAGGDFMLGAIPMIRWLAMQGTHVVIAANQRPTLNDMTIEDFRIWWPRLVKAEPSLDLLPITRVSTGTGEPLIDLGAVSPELNSAAADADLVILEGMGRGVESNLDAAFTCDALNIAMIKDVDVARKHRGKVFDVVCRFRRPTIAS
jgi:uncharacterized protein with ATP-grasp and redox domains